MFQVKYAAGKWLMRVLVAIVLGPAAFAQLFAQADISRASRLPGEDKLDTQLMMAVRLATATGRNSIPISLQPGVQSFVSANVAADQSIFIVIKAVPSVALVAALRSIGATEVVEYPLYETIHARVPISAVRGLALRSDVRSIGPKEQAQTNRYVPTKEELETRFKNLRAGGGAVGNIGAVTWEGVVAHKANQAITAGKTGTGTSVCVLSDGVNTLAGRQATGDLGTVTVVPGQAGSGDEGTAMLEIVHDMAPGANLYFATGFGGVASMATNIVTLRNTYACDIIVDDVSYYNEGAFQDGPIAQAVNTVTTAGAMYFSSAANSGNLTHGTSGTFEGDFVASGAAIPSAISAYDGTSVVLHSFGALPYTTLTQATSTISLKWSDPLSAATNDYDLFVLDSTGTTVLGVSANSQTGTQDPFESVSCTNCQFPVGARIYVVKYSGSARAIRIDTHRGRISIGTAGSTYGHNAAATAISVAAVNVATASGGVFVGGATNPVETYSSDGPRKIFYTPAGAAVTPGNVLFATNGGTTLSKVDLAASDCGVTTTPGLNPFCGTSAAAPTAAALAALIKGANPGYTSAQVLSALKGTALDIEAAGSDRDSGVGIVMTDPSLYSSTVYSLSVSKVGIGTVTSNPAGISCGGTCSANFNSGTSVTLTAAPDPGYTFSSWGGACTGSASTCMVSMTAARSVVASFTATASTRSISVTKTGSGTINSSPAGIACGTSCSGATANFSTATNVYFTATPDSGYTFTGWSGACVGTGTCMVAAGTGAASLGATFTASGGGGVTVLQNGVAVSGIGGAQGSSTYYSITVPSGATNLVVSTSGGAGDVDLYVRAGQLPSTSTADCYSNSTSTTESCTFGSPAAGTYYVMLYGYAAYSGVSVVASYAGGSATATPTYRFNNPYSGGHFFTSNESEKAYVLANLPAYHLEGVGFYTYPTQAANSLPIYRFSYSAGFHYFTISETEKSQLLTDPNYKYDGIAFYGFNTPVTGTVPVYRFRNSIQGSSFYTANVDEYNYVMLNLPTYVYQSIVFYVRTAP